MLGKSDCAALQLPRTCRGMSLGPVPNIGARGAALGWGGEGQVDQRSSPLRGISGPPFPQSQMPCQSLDTSDIPRHPSSVP